VLAWAPVRSWLRSSTHDCSQGLPVNLLLLRGSATSMARANHPRSPEWVELTRDLSTGQAFRAIAFACLEQLLAGKTPMLRGNSEGLHQMRVAVRRLRAALSAFSKVVHDRHAPRIRRELDWLATALAPARDLDVLHEQVLQPLRKRHAREPGITALCRDLEVRRISAHREAAAVVRSMRFQSLVSDLRSWVDAGAWSSSRDEAGSRARRRSVVTHATEELARRHRKLCRRQPRALSSLTPVQRHRLRIRAKKMRYVMEFFGCLYTGRKRTRRRRAALSALRDLQDALGALNDIATREALTSHLVTRQPRGPRGTLAKAFAAGVIFGVEDAHVQALLDIADRAYRKFRKVKPFWS
jgi:triphosphatase